jgi:hypothetical protein
VNALDRIELDAAADFWAAAPPSARAAFAPDARSVAGAACLWCRSLEPTLMFRRALFGHAPDPAALDAVEHHMNTLGGRWAIGLPAGEGEPAELARRGYRQGYAWMKFRRHCDAAPAPPTDLALRVLDAPGADAFAQVVAEGYGLPEAARPWLAALPGRARWVCAAAFDGAVPVAAAAAYVDGDLAWLGFAATLPAARRRGAQGALLALRLAHAHERGARDAVTETGERVPDKPSASYRNILRAGFLEVALRRHWLPS